MDMDSASANRWPKYDVFLSFEGKDRYDNVARRLCAYFSEMNINVFWDKTLDRGKEISPSLDRVIENSKLAVVIFSKNYGYSPKCLSELVHIHKCWERNRMVVVPVFCQVDPSILRKQQIFYAKLYRKETDEVKACRDALTALTSLPGWDSNAMSADFDLVDAIVDDVEKHLSPRATSISDHSKEVGGIFQHSKSEDFLDTGNIEKHLSPRATSISDHFKEVFGIRQHSKREDFQDTDNAACSLKHDVFLSFNSQDTGNNFTSHLYAALVHKGIATYSHNDSERGHEISPEVIDVIQESKLYLIIFSRHYTFSSWCRNELDHVIQYSRKCRRFVVPVFYDVDPTSVRAQLKHYQRCRTEDKEGLTECGSKVDMSYAACLPSWDSKAIKPESKLIEEIVEDVIRKLKRISSNDISELVGISERVNSFKSMLDSGSSKVRAVAIVGMGGIGKTTLAKAVFDHLSTQFDASCFLANIRESWNSGRKKYLQNKIVSELSKGVDFKFHKDGLKRKKVLIVLDDVRGEEQLELLVGDRDQYGAGSRIIITSRDIQAFNKIDDVYRMTELSVSEALLLFRVNALGRNSFTDKFIHLSSAVVDSLWEHNPLILKVLGSVLRGKSNDTWVETIEVLRKGFGDEIQIVLRICYDRLEQEQKNIFLDIACFFKGHDEAFTTRILDGCWTAASKAVKDLVDMSLITIQDSKLWMHDFVEDLGKKIVQNQSIEEPGRRSRLWEAKDIYQVLTNNTGTAAVEAIFLDMSLIKKVELSPTAFSRMRNLRMLKLHSHFANCTLQFPEGDLQFLPYRLTYLFWDAYPFKSMSFGPVYNLVELQLQFSKVEQLWERGVQRLDNLKVIDLSFSKQLVEIPNLSRAPNVSSVSLRACGSLREVPSYFHRLEKLTALNLEDCSSLEKVLALPENIVHVNLARCNKLKSLPSNISELKSLRRLELSGCSSIDLTNFKKFGCSLKAGS